MANSTDSKDKYFGNESFWKEWYRLNSIYSDDITDAHKALKDMYGYNYESEFNDETKLENAKS